MKKKEIKIEEKKGFGISFKNRRRYFAVFLVQVGNTYSIIKKKRINPKINAIRFELGNAQTIDISKPSYSRGLDFFYFLDINKGQLYFEKPKVSEDSPAFTDAVLFDKVVSQLVSQMGLRKFGKNWFTYFTLLGLGIFIGLFIGQYL